MASGIEGRTVIQQETEALSARSLSPVELPAAVDDLAVSAARRLGWHGCALPEMTLLGRKVVVVAELRTEVHAERIALGCPPVTDRAEVSTWVWPEMAGTAPAPAVELIGVLGVARHWRTALASAAPFANYCDTGIVLPWSAAMTDDYLYRCLPRARRHGVSVLTADPDAEVNLDQIGRQDPLIGERNAIDRWLREAVYERMLALTTVV